MRVGFVTYWFPRGQATVSRFIKSILDSEGIETYVLARRGDLLSRHKDWQTPNLTVGPKDYNIEYKVYHEWAIKNKLDKIFFFQNYQFEEIEKLKKMGIETIGTFMWEQLGDRHIKGLKKAYSKVYSLHMPEHLRYKKNYGIETKYIRWGIHPELFVDSKFHSDKIVFHFPCGYNSDRKGVPNLVDAFRMVKDPNVRLFITAANKRSIDTKGDSRIIINNHRDESAKDFLKKSAQCHACIIPSRWEGLGMAFFEAIGAGKPIITIDAPPMNLHVKHKKTGLLARAHKTGKTRAGLEIYDLDIEHMAHLIKFMSDKNLLKRMSANTIGMQEEYNWDLTIKDILGLIND